MDIEKNIIKQAAKASGINETDLEDDAHSNGALTRDGAAVWQISIDKINAYRESKPEFFYRIVSRVAVGINRQLRLLSKQLHEGNDKVQVVGGYRLELCMAEPIIAYDLLHGMMILKNSCVTLSSRCVDGIEANKDVCRAYVENSIGLVTALVPVIGYEQSASIAKEAIKTGGSVYNLVLEKELLSREQLDDMLRPENMTDPREIPTK